MDEESLRKMKILIVQESDWLERGPHQQHQLADRLSMRGHQIRVIDYEILWRKNKRWCLFSKRQVFNNVWKVNQKAKVTVIRPSIVKIPLLDYISILFTHGKEVDRQIREFKPNVIVGFGILNAFLASRRVSKNGIPFIYYWIDVLHLLIPFKPLQLIGKIIEYRILRLADCVITINDKLKDYVLKAGASLNRTYTVKAGIDLEQFNPSINDGVIRKRYGLGKFDTVLFFMGWLYHFSGLREVISRLIHSDGLKVLVVGEGDDFEYLKQLVSRYGLENKVILTGKQPYHLMPSFISASDICLLPAYPNERIMKDIVPIKMYEYMAMAKPVIATRLSGVVKEFGEDNGVVYVDGPEDVISKAKELISNDKIGKLGIKARKFVEKYSWDNITDEFEKILQSIDK